VEVFLDAFSAQRLAEERMRDALREAERIRLVRAVSGLRGARRQRTFRNLWRARR
jgi:hypothetical protein